MSTSLVYTLSFIDTELAIKIQFVFQYVIEFDQSQTTNGKIDSNDKKLSTAKYLLPLEKIESNKESSLLLKLITQLLPILTLMPQNIRNKPNIA